MSSHYYSLHVPSDFSLPSLAAAILSGYEKYFLFYALMGVLSYAEKPM